MLCGWFAPAPDGKLAVGKKNRSRRRKTMFMDMEHSLVRDRNEQILREVRANRIARRPGRSRQSYFRFIRNLRGTEREVEPKSA